MKNSTKTMGANKTIKFLEALKRLGVANYSTPELTVAFCNTLPDNKIEVVRPDPVMAVEMTKIDTEVRKNLVEEMTEDELDALLIENPVEYERLMMKRLSEEG